MTLTAIKKLDFTLSTGKKVCIYQFLELCLGHAAVRLIALNFFFIKLLEKKSDKYAINIIELVVIL